MKVRIADIKIGKRFRKDAGNVVDLSQSIHKLGLLHPIVLDKDNTLIAGLRRLEAVKLLGWKEVECTVANGIEDATKQLLAERDENTCRVDFTPSEIVAIGAELEALEAPRAAQRKNTARHNRHGDGKLPPPSELGETREKVGAALGVSGRTYDKMKSVVNAAAEDPETFGHLADELEQTGKASGPYEKMQAIKKGKRQEPQEEQETNGRTPVGVLRANEAIDRLMLIPKNDPHRKRGFQIVTDWIRHNK